MAKFLFILAAPLVLILLSIAFPSVSGLPAALNGHYQHHEINQNIHEGLTTFNAANDHYQQNESSRKNNTWLASGSGTNSNDMGNTENSAQSSNESNEGIIVTVIMLRIPSPLADSGRVAISLKPSSLEIEYNKLSSPSSSNNNLSTSEAFDPYRDLPISSHIPGSPMRLCQGGKTFSARQQKCVKSSSESVG